MRTRPLQRLNCQLLNLTNLLSTYQKATGSCKCPPKQTLKTRSCGSAQWCLYGSGCLRCIPPVSARSARPHLTAPQATQRGQWREEEGLGQCHRPSSKWSCQETCPHPPGITPVDESKCCISENSSLPRGHLHHHLTGWTLSLQFSVLLVQFPFFFWEGALTHFCPRVLRTWYYRSPFQF